jgi:hypothetical protein
MKLSADYFINQAEAEAKAADEGYDFFVQPTEAIAKWAALEAAKREVAELAEAVTA